MKDFEFKEYSYKLNCSEYVLHEGDKPIGPLLNEVGIVFDKENGTLHKHGSPEMVEKWFTKTREKMTSAGFQEIANNLIMISGRFPLDQLNKCLTTTGYVLRMYKEIQTGQLEHCPEFPLESNTVSRSRMKL